MRERAHELLAGTDTYDLVDISGITGWTRCWAVHEMCHDRSERIITLLQFDVSAEYFTYKYIPETMGPNAVDCPQRLLSAVIGYAPLNDFAAEWRERAHAYHEQLAGVRRLLREIGRRYPSGDRRLAVNGQVVCYERGRQSGRWRHAYRKPSIRGLWGPELWGLRPEAVDLEASAWIREQPRTVRELPRTAETPAEHA